MSRPKKAGSEKVSALDGWSFADAVDWAKRPHWVIAELLAFSAAWVWLRNPVQAAVSASVLVGWLLTWRLLSWRQRILHELAQDRLPDPGWWHLSRIGRLGLARRRIVLQQWKMACGRVLWDVSRDKSGTQVPPKLRRLRINASGDITADVFCWETALRVEDLQMNRHTLAPICRAHDLVIRKTKDIGNATITFQFSDYLDRVLTFGDLPSPTVRGRMVVGIDETGRPVELLTSKPILIGGEPGSGKSTDVWAMLGSLLQQGIWFRIYVADRKRLEFRRFRDKVGQQLGRMFVADYAEETADCLAMFKKVYTELEARNALLADQGIRKLEEGTEKLPLLILIVDEALDFSSEWKKGESDLVRFTNKCRAAYALTIAMAQYGHAAAFGEGRKAFGQRLCGRGEKETADTILGNGSWEAGAHVNEIPRDQPGVQYARDDTGWMVRWKSVKVLDEDADAISNGILPVGVPMSDPIKDWCTYRFHGFDGDCLYVGFSDDPVARKNQHADEKPWWPEVDLTKWEISWVRTEAEARKLESAWVARYLPRYNDQQNRKNPRRIDWRRQLKEEVREPEEVLR
jgi:hypothetical protein